MPLSKVPTFSDKIRPIFFNSTARVIVLRILIVVSLFNAVIVLLYLPTDYVKYFVESTTRVEWLAANVANTAVIVGHHLVVIG
jgi:hypothetical protein